ncbi:MAG TPA: regulatory iron-sulfur-containing complex subunit RicT [Saprospiraceae bacterium]|nr:regulatory iron-sulfur-containing complex subunit RicT [Saprospiraceae bacterium]
MGCSNCSYDKNGVPAGCGDKGHCTSGSCNKMNTYDWLATKDIYDPIVFPIVEVSFKKGSRKDFFLNPDFSHAITGDMVVVETNSGYDVGRINLSGDLVRLQMKKKNFPNDRLLYKILRKANERDLEKLEEVREKEKEVMVRARVIARTLGLDMKLGDVEFQGDGKKATFYYTADNRVDFRELVRQYARDFRIKIEMRQIGSRQESARIGGLGSCGRELCCSTWLSDFKSVTTSAARYQNIAINQTKLSGQCGRLKCCLNYELDIYLDALKDFPENPEKILTEKGPASLIKTDIFKGLLFYAYDGDAFRGVLFSLSKEKVKDIIIMNQKGEVAGEQFLSDDALPLNSGEQEVDFADVTGEIELPHIKRRKSKSKRRRQGSNTPPNQNTPSTRTSDTLSQGQNRKQPDQSMSRRKKKGRNNNQNKQ